MMPGESQCANSSVVLVKPKPLRCGSVGFVSGSPSSPLPGLTKVIERKCSLGKKFEQQSTCTGVGSVSGAASSGQMFYGYPMIPASSFGPSIGSSISATGYLGFGFSYTSFPQPQNGFPIASQVPGIPVQPESTMSKSCFSRTGSICEEGQFKSSSIPILTTTTTTTTTVFSGIGSMLPTFNQIQPTKPSDDTSMLQEESQGGESDQGSSDVIVESQPKKKRVYRKRVRSAEVDKLSFIGLLSGPEDEMMNCVRVWINSKGTKFYDCKCGTRKAIHDLKKIKEHVCRHFNSKKRKGIINFC